MSDQQIKDGYDGRPIKSYFGDSIYVELNEYDEVILTTENGFGPSNTIIFESGTFDQLASFVKGLARERQLRST